MTLSCFARLFSSRVLQMLVLVLAASGVARASEPLSATSAQRIVTTYGVGTKVKLRLADHSRMKGRIVAIGAASVELKVKGSKMPVNVPFANIVKADGVLSVGEVVGGVAIFIIGVPLLPLWFLFAATGGVC